METPLPVDTSRPLPLAWKGPPAPFWMALIPLALTAIATLGALQGCAESPPPGAEEGGALQPGPWRATLASPGGAITFGLDLVESKGRLQAVLVNGEERQPAGLLEEVGDKVRFEVPPYRSAIVATIDSDGRGLTGYWERDLGDGPAPLLPFAAIAGADARPPTHPQAEAVARLNGRWRVRFDGDEEHAVGLFAVAPTGRASGTFLTTLGDYRYLSGWFDGEALWLACFDGAHAFLFEAHVQEDGALRGDFWSKDSFHTTWTATRDDAVELPDDFTLTRWAEGASLEGLAFADMDGTRHRIADLISTEAPALLVVFGTWCPNCNDLSEALVELHRRYPALQIIGVAFELGSDPAAHREAVKGYVAHHQIQYPVLIGGTASKEAASEALPILDKVRAYPTTVFIAPGGRPSAVHTGFSGPATGDRHLALIERFESEIESLLGGD